MSDEGLAREPVDAEGHGGAVTLRFQFTRSEFLQMMRRRLLRRSHGWAYLLLGPALAAVGAVTSNRSDIISGGVYVIFWVGLYYGWCPRRVWKATSELQGPQVLTFSNEGLVIDTLQATSNVRWNYWSDVFKDRDAYVLSAKGRNVFIPIRAFTSPESEATFQRLAAAVSGQQT